MYIMLVHCPDNALNIFSTRGDVIVEHKDIVGYQQLQLYVAIDSCMRSARKFEWNQYRHLPYASSLSPHGFESAAYGLDL